MVPQANEDIKRRGGAAKDAVGDFVHRLRADRANRALRLVLLRKAGDNGDLYLAPADARHMILLLSTDGGNEMRVLAVRDGAMARDELSRLTVEINPVSGAVEVIDQSEVSANVVALPDRSGSAASCASTVDETCTVTPSPDVSAVEGVEPDFPVLSRTPLFARY
ncbi:hypothetical protein, partial [Streptomyces sp. RKCA744]|uniref:hypothetical protein n=1 Tax=Streptomyces sp. RKCA744 TaxID=2959340 RepID=UPI00209DEC88